MIRRYKSAREKRKARVRAKIKGRAERPRLSVFRSNRYLYAQIIDDEKGRTLVAASEFDLGVDKKPATLKTEKRTENTESSVPSEKLSALSVAKTERARLIGKILAQKALKFGINKVVFDRGSYKYHGRVKALAEGAREGGLIF